MKSQVEGAGCGLDYLLMSMATRLKNFFDCQFMRPCVLLQGRHVARGDLQPVRRQAEPGRPATPRTWRSRAQQSGQHMLHECGLTGKFISTPQTM
jgi:hypothetical protein